MTPDYSSLDEAIVKAIRDGVYSTAGIVAAAGFRLKTYGRMQMLQESGLIVYNNGRWSAVRREDAAEEKV